MREEFPVLTRLGRPEIAVEPLWWAFLAGLGAGPVVGGIVRIAFLWLGPLLFPPTRPHPDWLTVNTIVVTVSVLAVGAVLMRAGGVVAVAVYLGYELARQLAALPGRALFCKNAGANLPPTVTGCDFLALVTEHWVTWLGLLIGAAIGLLFLRTREGENGLLRAAGAFSFVLVVVSTLVGLAFLGRNDTQNPMLALFTIANVIGGGFAGTLLARERLAAAVLLAVLIVAPGVSLALPLALQSPNTPSLLLRWSGVYVPGLAALALVTARGYVRKGDGGTFF